MFTSYRSLARRLAPALVMSLVLWGALIAGASVAFAGGSDDPTPYTVDRAGITLPEGDTFQAHGHVNIRWSNPDGSAGIHFDPNNGHPGGKWIGKSFIPWSAFGVPKKACITWVQISHYNEHFGEGGQSPVCLGKKPKPTPDPEPTPSPEPTPDPEPTPEPTPDPEPTPEPTPTPSPDPTPDPEPTPEPEPSPSPSPEPTSEPSPTPTPTSEPEPEPTETPGATPTPSPSAPAPDDDELDCPEGKAPGWLDENGAPTSCVDDDPTPWPDPIPDHTPKIDPLPDETPDDDAPEPGEELAETGATTGALAVIALVLLVVGVGIAYLNYRSKKE